jgi:hypothetical protein
MPPPNLAALQGNCAAILPWLNNNLLLGGYLQNTADPHGLAWAQFVVPPQIPFPTTADDGQGHAMDVFAVRSDGNGVHDAVRAYICNYQANDVRAVDLQAAADFCFTINLNGCTFAMGAAAPNGDRRVCHANQGGNTLTQRNQTWNALGVPANTRVAMLEPAEYRRLGGGGNLNATVFGIRDHLHWSFYFQLYTALGQGRYQVHGVFPIQEV